MVRKGAHSWCFVVSICGGLLDKTGHFSLDARLTTDGTDGHG